MACKHIVNNTANMRPAHVATSRRLPGRKRGRAPMRAHGCSAAWVACRRCAAILLPTIVLGTWVADVAVKQRSELQYFCRAFTGPGAVLEP